MPGADGTKSDRVCTTYLLSRNQKYISQYYDEFLLKRDLKSGFVCLIIYRKYRGVKNAPWTMSRIATVGLDRGLSPDPRSRRGKHTDCWVLRVCLHS